ncbi:flap endonuclease 1 [Pyrobaculum islandicum DSM 4184]|uniref:Flap endonuclease 1 n=1 Tax=Pyrobaculum islandicum (strain DSM 4184 / JCM 9189 / GEO3) TaxID=384616 RepID=FEN_PYRIL|nr:flap endonuclease-1 [Pyrobaculum islandicum]A1RSC7.1 RecName: Full=Flap endonuclease 1; Short=FEN-1; AltName: Full=Flap structure-specific endonuclease 1 [Pyrobaculum islandicum DSM 4184]ABL87859.1 flap endonuclease 1 [Pyrobaculum islandicum DSM 4184]
MGVTELGKLIGKDIRREVKLENLAGKCIALDAYNSLYQFLASIRQPDGTPLMDRVGRITSHLSGLFYRTINLMEAGIKPVYVFDGKPPEFKLAEIEERRKVKEKAMEEVLKAIKEGRKEDVAKYMKRAVFLTSDMVEDAKKLLTYMGVPWVQAPSEGEAQAAHMAKRGHCWAVGSQDYDSLLFGSPRLVRNLAVSPRRKIGEEVIELSPEIIELDAVLKSLRLKNREQLIDLAILLGTDYNPDGVPGVGPQKALKLVWEFGGLEKMLETVLRGVYFPVDPLEIKKFFLNPPVTDEYSTDIKKPDEQKLIDFLVREHDFSEDRVLKAVERLKRAQTKYKISSLDSFF